MFRNSPSPNLITYHGSFRNESTGYLLLEYADQGNLEEFFSSQEHPQSAKDVEMFWTSLLRTLTGLDRIHQVMTANNYLIQG
jgi:serine/threonine protein kinase